MTEREGRAQHHTVVGGVDTHGDTHHAAVVDEVGRHLADHEFPATPAGYRRLLAWLRSFGRLDRVGVEGTGAYGAALARMLAQAGVAVVEVDRPDRKVRRSKGKSDPVDAYAAAWRHCQVGRPARRRAAPAASRPSAPCGRPGAARSRPAPRRSISSAPCC
ncbi:transposase [Micromonospora profundi]|uniref:Transposase n=1 Tax=Micromonospora profundi TaxID=1420889 RepID=A0AAJ6L3J8_9ACTN|nr:transposase [Micromonospora profundi]WLS43303.1 transposase [Micromonospora profundi]